MTVEPHRSPWWANVLLSLVTFLFTVAITIGADRFMGFMWPAPTGADGGHGGLVFSPGTAMRYRTSEFTFTAHINDLGFRGRPFPVEPRAGEQRIAIVGDSYTFGWGVPLTETWPYLVQERLRQTGHPVAVANLGKPGGIVGGYVDIAERAVLRLQPDLLVVAVNVGEDISQVLFRTLLMQRLAHVWSRGAETAPDRPWSYQQVLRRAYPNLLRLVFASGVRSTRAEWRHTARGYLSIMSRAERARFERLDPAVRDDFLAGLVNPYLIITANACPQFYTAQLRTNRAPVRAAVAEVAAALQRIQTVAAGQGVRTLVITVPYAVFISREAQESQARLGLHVNQELLTSAEPDRLIASAASAAELPFASVTPTLRAQDSTGWYFPIDAHMTPAGNAAYAAAIAPVLLAELAATPPGAAPAQ